MKRLVAILTAFTLTSASAYEFDWPGTAESVALLPDGSLVAFLDGPYWDLHDDYVVRVSAEFELLWARHVVVQPYYSNSSDALVVRDDTSIVAISGISSGSADTIGFHAECYDINGNQLWQLDNLDIWTHDAAVSPNGYIYLVGWTHDDSLPAVACMSRDLETIWITHLSVPKELYAIAAIDSSGICVGGYVEYEQYSEAPFVIRLDTDGNVVWSGDADSQNDLYRAYDIAVSSSGTIAICGEASWSGSFIIGIDSATGEVMWRIKDLPYYRLNAITSVGEEFVAVGWGYRCMGMMGMAYYPRFRCGYPWGSAEDWGALAVRASEEGELLNSFIHGVQPHDEVAYDVCATSSGNYVMVGRVDYSNVYAEILNFEPIVQFARPKRICRNCLKSDLAVALRRRKEASFEFYVVP
jgi:hypothetical protein